MHPFTITRVTDPISAIRAHSADQAVSFIAGGTDLLSLIKDGAALPKHLLDINALPGMAAIDVPSDGSLRIGALTRMSDLAAHPAVRQHYPMVSESLLFAASGQLRNMASIGGNIMQRTRCAYFRDGDGLPCNKREPGSGCSALRGIHRTQSIFGWSDSCVATHPSDLAVALAALDAAVHVRGLRGDREIPFSEFHRLPGNTPEKDNALERGELILAIEIPAREEARKSHYLKVVIGNRTNLRSSRQLPPWPLTMAVSARCASRWEALHTSRGGCAPPRRLFAGCRLPMWRASGARLPNRSSMPAPWRTTHSRWSSLSAAY